MSSRRLIPLVLALLSLTAVGSPAAAHHTRSFDDVRGDANGVNDQLEGICCDVATAPASIPQADIVRTSVHTKYRDGRPQATKVRITLAGKAGHDYGYELRMQSARCGSIFGFFTASSGRITEECDTSRTRVTHHVQVRSRRSTVTVTMPYGLNENYGLLGPGDRLDSFQTITNAGGALVAPPRLDWANAPHGMRFTVGR